MSLILPANSLTGGYEIDNSLRFNDGSSDYLNRTPASAGNRQKFTVSFWTKRGELSGSYRLFSAGSDGTECYFGADALAWYYYSGGYIGQYKYQNTALFRDVSAWYHIIIAIDTTQATASNRVKMYVNGIEGAYTQVTIPQNTQVDWNNTVGHYIGRYSAGSSFFYDGYISEFYNIDGQQLDATSFGEFDSDSGIWKPIKYTGTYGTNGFYLDFENSGSLGADQSGNGNNFTVNNLTSIDQVTDTPTNNFSTLNPLANGLTMSEGNLSVAGASDNNTGATIGVKSGKWYWEVKDVGGVSSFGIANSANRIGTSNQSSATGMYLIQSIGSGSWYSYTNGSFASTSVPVHSAGDILNFALDADNGKLYIGKNGSYINSSNSSANPATDTNPFFSSISTAEFLIPFTEMRTGGGDADFNFGNPPYSANGYTDGAGYGNFSYAVPSGYYSLNSKNLAEFG